MAKHIPVIHSINFFYLIPQIGIILVFITSLYFFGNEHYLILGLSLYFLLSIYLKVLIPKWHRKGIYLLKKGKLDLAILAFNRSYDYFKRYPWIDRYRAFTLFSTSRNSYTEMALMNIIYCFEQLGDAKSARKFHKILREEFPGNQYSAR